jgi:hypothetical protein
MRLRNDQIGAQILPFGRGGDDGNSGSNLTVPRREREGLDSGATSPFTMASAKVGNPPIVAIHGRNQTSPWDQTERLEGRLI